MKGRRPRLPVSRLSQAKVHRLRLGTIPKHGRDLSVLDGRKVEVNTPSEVTFHLILLDAGEKAVERLLRAATFRPLTRLLALPKRRNPCREGNHGRRISIPRCFARWRRRYPFRFSATWDMGCGTARTSITAGIPACSTGRKACRRATSHRARSPFGQISG